MTRAPHHPDAAVIAAELFGCEDDLVQALCGVAWLSTEQLGHLTDLVGSTVGRRVDLYRAEELDRNDWRQKA
jgi:hypothetical protein